MGPFLGHGVALINTRPEQMEIFLELKIKVNYHKFENLLTHFTLVYTFRNIKKVTLVLDVRLT